MDLKIYNIRFSIDFLFIIITVAAFLAGLHIEVFAALLAIGIHELGHIFVGYQLGLKIKEIQLLPFGGRIKMMLEEASIDAEMITAIAGPFANFLAVGFIIFLFKQNFITEVMFRHLIHYQLMLGIFNMIPALPLDGGRIFMLWLRQRFGYTSAVRIAANLGKITALLLFTIAAWGMIKKKIFLSLIVAGFFLFYMAYNEYRDASIVLMKYLTKKREFMLKKKCMIVETIIVTEDTPIRQVLHMFAPQKYCIVFAVDNYMRIKKYFTETEIFDKVVEKGLDLKVKDLL